MSRIRTVKPEFWSHPKVTAVSRDARLLFLGMLNEVDDEGRVRYIPKRLAGVVFPEDDDVDGPQVDRWSDELEHIGLICRYEVDGARLLQVVGFSEHQVINRPSPSRLPASLTEPSVNGHGRFIEDSRGEGKGMEGKGMEGKGTLPADTGETAPKQRKPNPLWDALVVVFGEASTESRRGMYGKAVRELRPTGATPEDVIERGRALVAKYDDPTPMALTKHWDALRPRRGKTIDGIEVTV